MRRWTILISILIIGIAIAVGVWFFVKVSTNENLVDTPTQERGFLSFFGDRLGFSDNVPTATTTTGNEPAVGPTFRQRLKRAGMLPIGDFMIAGMTFTTAWEVSSTTGATTTEESVRFVERETGHVADLSLESGETRRVTNTTIPAIQEVVWGGNGSSVALRYLGDDNETIETFVSPLATTSPATPVDLIGTFFPQNIPSMAMSPSRGEVFYITTATNGSFGTIANLSNENRQTILTSFLSEWAVAWEAPLSINITSRPSALAAGVSYSLSRDGGAERLIWGQGLTVLSNPSGTHILYALASTESFRSFVITQATGEIMSFSIRTLPEKCLWRNDDELICAVPNTIPTNVPDAWYQGRVSFTDTLWIIDVPKQQYDFLYAPEDTDARQTMDMIDLDLSDDGTVLSLINKKDLRGWVADVGNTDTNN